MWFQIMVVQFELGFCEGQFKFSWISVEVFCNFMEFWVFFYCDIGSEYNWFVMFSWIVCVRYYVCCCVCIWNLLSCISWVFCFYLIEVEQVVQVVGCLLGWCNCLCIFQVVGNGVFRMVFIIFVFLIKVLVFQFVSCRFCINIIFRIFCVVCFIKGVVICDQCNDFFVIYCYLVK